MQESTEISIFDVVHFLISNIKLFIASTLICGLIGFGVTWLQPQFTATALVYYSGKEADFSNKHFDLVTWRKTQHKLALLAQELSAGKSANQSQLLSLAAPTWWSLHVAPIKALTLDESKELLGINSMIVGPNKPSDESDTMRFLGRAIKESTRISGISVSITAATAEQALSDAAYSAKFIQQGIGILEYRDLIFAMNEKLLLSEEQTVIDLDQATLALAMQQKRRDALASLQREYPNERASTQALTVTEATTKYLPLTNQLIAVNIDISELKDRILLLNQQKNQNKLTADFLQKANQTVRDSAAFNEAGDQLLAVISKLKAQTGGTDIENNLTLNLIGKQLRHTQGNIKSEVTLGATTLTKQPDYLKSTIKSAFLGLALGLILSLLSLLLRISLKRSASLN